MPPAARSLISIDDLTDDELPALAARAAEFSAGHAARPLEGRIVGTYFAKTSTRTRTAFSAGALRLGAGLVAYGPDDLQINTGESVEDTGRVFAEMLDVIVARTAGDPAVMRGWAVDGRLAVVNAMSADEHPTQAIADLTTLQRRFGRLRDLRILYVGEGNNTAASLALALSRLPDVELELRTPHGYGLAADILARAQAQCEKTGSRVVERHDMHDVPPGFEVIYTTRWQTTGTSKADPDWREVFAPFQVRRQMWETSPEALFMHDLPAHRGDEVTAEVLDGPMSIAFEQAANKMYSAMAVLEWSRPDASGEGRAR